MNVPMAREKKCIECHPHVLVRPININDGLRRWTFHIVMQYVIITAHTAKKFGLQHNFEIRNCDPRITASNFVKSIV